MKIFSLTAIAILTASVVLVAQTKSNNIFQVSPQQAKHFAGVQALLSYQQKTPYVLHSSEMQQRVVAQVFERQSEDVDSIVYKYNTIRGSQYNYNHILEPGYSSVLIPDLTPAYANIFNQPSTDVLADTFKAFFNAAKYYQAYGSYNGKNKLDSLYRLDIAGEYENIEMSYLKSATDGLLDTFMTATSDKGSNFSPLYLRALKYNRAKQVTSDMGFYHENGLWMNMQEFIYHYNDAGLVDTLISIGADDYSERSIFTYDKTGRIISIKQYSLDEDNVYQHYLTDSFSYTTDIAYVTSFEEKYYKGGILDGAVRIRQYPGTNGKPDSIVSQILIGENWISASKGVFYYNDHGNPSSIKFIEAMSGVRTSLRFYYESYDAGLSLEAINISKDFTIYPNPFNNSLIIYHNEKLPQQVTISITNVSGQHIYRQSLRLSEIPAAISLPEIASGVYMVQVTDSQGKVYTQKLVKK